MTASKSKNKQDSQKNADQNDEDSEMAESDEETGNSDNELLSCYQLLLSLLSLLTKAETSRKTRISEATLRMKQVSELVAKVASFETR